MSWKDSLRRDPGGFYRLRTEGGEVRIFMSEDEARRWLMQMPAG